MLLQYAAEAHHGLDYFASIKCFQTASVLLIMIFCY
jgi:hypothetical protein